MRRSKSISQIRNAGRAFPARAGLALLVGLLAGSEATAQVEPDESHPRLVDYEGQAGLADPVARLQKRLDLGQAKLQFQPFRGYLESLLKELEMPVSSQVLVFSKTSSQREHTSPQTPRAIYFSDNVYLAWAPDSEVIDLAAQDPVRGTIFYTLDQTDRRSPRFLRPASCLQCHLAPKTLNVPGLLVRSIYTAPDGTPLAQVPGFINGHNSPLDQRWGGWYVTGVHPASSHLGNIFATNSAAPEEMNLSAGQNITDLRGRFNDGLYLSPHSDLVALLVLEHETRMHNLITRANYETRDALADVAKHGAEAAHLDREWPRKRIEQAGEMLLEYMLFRNEAPLHGAVSGTSAFAADFANSGPRDAKRRSLRQLDLQKRLFRYPCSFLVYSGGFDALPAEMKEYLWARLAEILGGRDQGASYAGMSCEDRQVVFEILRDTKPEFAAWLRSGARRQAKRDAALDW